MSNRKKIVRMYHVKFTSDFLVPALSRQEALELAEDAMVEMIEDEEIEFGDIFRVTVESNKFHVVTEEEDETDDEDNDDDNDNDNDGEDENGDGGEDDGEEDET